MLSVVWARAQKYSPNRSVGTGAALNSSNSRCRNLSYSAHFDGKPLDVDRFLISFIAERLNLPVVRAEMCKRAVGACGLPRRRGPKAAHKCTEAIIAFVFSRRPQDPHRSLQELGAEVEDKFGVRLHPRTLQRQLVRQDKKRHRTMPGPYRRRRYRDAANRLPSVVRAMT
jgi:hypothetical protein